MSAGTQLLLAETILLPNAGLAQFTERGLSIAKHASESDLINIGHRLFAVRGNLKWMLGSLFSAMIEKRDGGAPADQHGKEDGGVWLSSFTEAQDLDPKERREMLSTYLFYRGAKSTPGGSWAHHYEAAIGGGMQGQQGALDRALAYLAHAHTHNLTVTQLRRHIRTTQATTPPDTQQDLELGNYGVIFEVRRFAAREFPLLSTYTPERAALILSDLGEDTLAYIDALRELAAQHEQATA